MSTRSVEGDVRFVGGFAQPGQGVAQDARDVHLRAAHAFAELALDEVFLEAQAQDLARAIVEDVRELREGCGVLGSFDLAAVVG
jgi:hypothetical protein